MEYYDVIIVGAGIAGCGLAYNLRRIGYKGSVLIIDKKGAGSNAGYGYRNTFEDVVKEYNLPYEHTFDGIKVGTYDKTYLKIKKKFYFVDYKLSCHMLLKKSHYVFREECAIEIKGKNLLTNKGCYKFGVIIDSSGNNFFTRKKLNKIIPSRYWIGILRVVNKKIKSDNYFYHQFSDYDYLEDLYPLKNRTLQGDWQYVKRVNFNFIQPPKRRLYEKFLGDSDVEQTFKAVIPCAHVPPKIKRFCICLGDSFGNAYTSSACGIAPILNSSEILANAIDERNLKIFEKKWERKYYKDYTNFLVSKFDSYNNNKFFISVKRYPERTKMIQSLNKDPSVFIKLLEGDSSVEFPEETKKLFPKRQKLFQLIYWIFLNSQYRLFKYM